MLTLRVRALYRNVRWAVWLLWITFALFHGLRLFTILFGEAAVYREVSFSQVYQRTDIVFTEHIKYSPINRTSEVAHMGNSSGAFMGLAWHTIRSSASRPHCFQSAEGSYFSRIKSNCTCRILVAIRFGPRRGSVSGIASTMRRILHNGVTGFSLSS